MVFMNGRDALYCDRLGGVDLDARQRQHMRQFTVAKTVIALCAIALLLLIVRDARICVAADAAVPEYLLLMFRALCVTVLSALGIGLADTAIVSAAERGRRSTDTHGQ